MKSITANELKRNGVTGIEKALSESKETSLMVDVRGKTTYIILSEEEFRQYREYQLDKAIAEAEECLRQDKFEVIDDLDNYAKKLEDEINGGL